MRRLLGWLPFVAAIACLVAYVVFRAKDPEKLELNEAARAQAPGRFVRLADGVTHYEVAGPDTGRVVLLASAFSVPGFMWDPLFQRLADSGFRVVRLDWYGRGWSDRIDAIYDQDLFVRQMAGVLDAIGAKGPVTVAGISYGSAMVTSFADAHPERVGALIYMEPVLNNGRQLPPQERSRLAWDVHMVLKDGGEKMALSQAYDFMRPEGHDDYVARYRVQQRYKGTREAWRRTRAAIAVAPDQMEQLRRVGMNERPVLLVWARQDEGAPFSESPAILAALPRATFVPVDSAAHMPHAEQPEVVTGAVVRFLRGLAPT